MEEIKIKEQSFCLICGWLGGWKGVQGPATWHLNKITILTGEASRGTVLFRIGAVNRKDGQRVWRKPSSGWNVIGQGGVALPQAGSPSVPGRGLGPPS